jgi:hypothetical protein
MKSQYLKDILSLSTGEAGKQGLRGSTKLFYCLANFLQKFFIYYMVRLYVPFMRKMEGLDRSLQEPKVNVEIGGVSERQRMKLRSNY